MIPAIAKEGITTITAETLLQVLDWGEFWSPPYVYAIAFIVRFLVEVSAFIAIIVIELPPSWTWPWGKHSEGDTDLELRED